MLREQIAELNGRLQVAEERAERAEATRAAELTELVDRYDASLEKMRGAWTALTTEVNKAVAKPNVKPNVA